MKPFDYLIRDAYLSSGLVWEWKSDPLSQKTILQEIKEAWELNFKESLPELDEPYDLQKGDILYVFPNSRFLFVTLGPDWKFHGAEIREKQDLFWITQGNTTDIRLSFNARTPSHAISKPLEYTVANRIKPPWFLFQQLVDLSIKPSIIYRSYE